MSYVAALGDPADRPGDVARDFSVGGTFVLIAGGVVSLATATTGFWDWWKGMPRRKTGPLGQAHHTQVWRTANWHMAVMLTVTAIVAVDIALRLAQFDRHAAQLPTTVLSVLAGLLVAYGATYGGSLVFDYQFNVSSLASDSTQVWTRPRPINSREEAAADRPLTRLPSGSGSNGPRVFAVVCRR